MSWLYIDIDGTMTLSPNGKHGPLRRNVVETVKARIAAGDKVVVWSVRGSWYAEQWCKKNGVEAAACLAKPDVVIDDKPELRKIMRIISPDRFVEDYG